MVDMGYDSFNPILNLGTLFILITMYFARILFFFLVLRPMFYKGKLKAITYRQQKY